MSAALSTRGLDKSFGSLVVARGIEFSLPQGARHALIGPNGAGKTTLINLMTGMLRPDAGEILLGEENITGLAPNQRVTRGLVRTFQINTLFPDLNALEALGFQRSADVLVILILGGAGRLYGGLVGAIIFMVARDQFSGNTPQFWYFWIGVLLVTVVMALPNGILGGLSHIFARWRRK